MEHAERIVAISQFIKEKTKCEVCGKTGIDWGKFDPDIGYHDACLKPYLERAFKNESK